MSYNITIFNTINYLNKKANTSFKDTSFANDSNLIRLIDQGYTLEDFKEVIDFKCEKWKGTEFEQYLRPYTLFGTKFESYLNEKRNRKNKLQKLVDSVEKAKRTSWKLDKK